MALLGVALVVANCKADLLMRKSTIVIGLLFMGVITTPTSAQVGCGTVAECAQAAVEAAEQARTALQLAAPRGAVMPFNLEQCPLGWEPLVSASGRVIVGAGQSEDLSMRTLGEVGGAEKHTLTADEMPRHSHNHFAMNDVRDRHRCSGSCNDNFAQRTSQTTTSTGGGQPHNNMQPYLVLLYCERQ